MMKKTVIVAVTLMFVSLAGCAKRAVPEATGYLASTQPKMQASHHWDVLAENLAAGISAKLATVPGNRPVYIVPANQGSEFARGLRSLLTSRLLEKGVAIATEEYGEKACQPACKPLLLKYDSQVVNFSERDGLHALPGDFSLMKGVSYLIYRVGDLWAAPAWGILPLSDYHENYFPPGTNSETIVSVTVSDANRLVFSDSRVYYINSADQHQYSGPAMAPAPTTKNFQVVE